METLNDIKNNYKNNYKNNLNNMSKEELVFLVESQQETIDWYQQLISSFNNKTYGKSSEKLPANQMSLDDISNLFNEAEINANDNVEEVQVAAHTKRKKKSRHLVEVLDAKPTTTIEYKLNDDELECPTCNDELHVLKKISKKEIKFIPAKLEIIEHAINQYACRECEANGTSGTIISAKGPDLLFKGSSASSSLVAHIANEKYEKAMPLYRQELSFKRQGIGLSRQTMSNWLMKASQIYLKPMYEQMHQDLLGLEVINADETTLRVINENGKVNDGSSYMWVYMSGRSEAKQMSLFQYESSRSMECSKQFLKSYRGILQTDGYSGYNGVKSIIRAGCWSHCRRKFKEHLDAISKDRQKESMANEYLKKIGELFALERKYDQKGYDYEKIKELREKEAKPVIDELYNNCEKISIDAMAQSKLKTALKYLMNQKEQLCAYLKDGRIEITNNRCENRIRPFVIGRKNWLFSNTENGAINSGYIYSIIESAKMNKLKPYDYMEYILRELPKIDMDNIEEISRYLPYSKELPEELYI